ncbi:non-ribosomal peptide synthetase [Paraflavitalea pollutisoli]|uniref:non-ribosomal peptide synthetase n=1 Tax=Paraflavitalea pollutisoli TaxID=3034143 RepID=UPI0023EBC0D9|nr:non-ribosomal peptide synthetase [Paraflavitalea sp. H1-2-19X]
MYIPQLIDELKSHDVYLALSGNDLEVSFPGDALSDTFIELIRAHKEALVGFLKSRHTGRETAIPVAAPSASYPVSSAQRRLWILAQVEESNIAYNMPGVFVFEGGLNRQALGASLQELLRRHEILRTVFREAADATLRQHVQDADSYTFELGYHDLRAARDPEADLKMAVRREIAQPFDLSNGPLLRTNLYQLTDDRNVFVYVVHHIVSDGWSMNILVEELMTLYHARCRGMSITLPALRIQYKDYAVWEQQQLNDGKSSDLRSYWLRQLGGELPVLALATDKPRPAVRFYKGDMVSRRLDPAVMRSVLAYCQVRGATLFMGLLAAVDVLLFRYTGQTDLVIGSPIAGREHTDLENQIGFYVNTLALRSSFEPTDSYAGLLQRVKRITLEAYDHQLYPFDELVDQLQLPRDRARNPLFDVWVVLQNTDAIGMSGSRELGDLKISSYHEEKEKVSKFDLSFLFTLNGKEIDLQLVYNTDLYTADTIQRMAVHLERLLGAAISAPDMPVGSLDYLMPGEKEQLLHQFNVTGASTPAGKTVVDLFREQALRTPDATALVFGEASLSYRELDERTDQLAAYLIAEGYGGKGALGAILLDTSIDLLVAIWAVLKAGMAYLPLDPASPPVRNGYVLEDAAPAVLLTTGALLAELPGYYGPQVLLDTDRPYAGDRNVPAGTARPEDLAYVIYTSGSTGNPKGVMIRHESLTDYCFGVLGKTNIQACTSFALASTVAADLGNTVIYTSLLTGGALHLFSKTALMDPEQLFARPVDCLKIVPTHWKALQGETVWLPNKCLLFGGEQLTPDVLSLIRNAHGSCEVYNHYGPTETTIGKLINRIDLSKDLPVIPLGAPFGDAAVYLLDDQQALVPVGIPGEICISGVGVASGYLHQPALTAQKFVANPFVAGTTMYKTGDIGRWLPDGKIEFLGRRDDQVKVHGYRVETKEVEAVLKQYPAIDAAVVRVRKNKVGENELVAYVVGLDEGLSSGLRTHLEKRLPAYMIPVHVVRLNKLPLTPNGKINRDLLPDPEGADLVAAHLYRPPETDTEIRLAVIWQQLLNRTQIGLQDDFFLSGGHSLHVIRLAGHVYQTFQVKLPIKDYFRHTTLQSQARAIQSGRKMDFESIAAAPSMPDYPLSSSQKRLWLLCQYAAGNSAYNIPVTFRFHGRLDVHAFDSAFRALLLRHEVLRTVFRNNDKGQVRQYIVSDSDFAFRMDLRDLRGQQDAVETVNRLLAHNAREPFDLQQGPLLRVSLYQVGDEAWVFNLVVHHIISDGWSAGIVFQELLLLYKAAHEGMAPNLAPLRIQYKDYACWEQQVLSGASLELHRQWWLQLFDGDVPVLNLPADKVRPVLKTFNGGAFIKQIDPAAASGLKALVARQGATLYMGLLAVVYVLLHRYTNQEDMVVGSPIAGREHADLENQVGFYLNMLALRTRFTGDDTFHDVLGKVKDATLEAFEHQAYPYDQLVEELHLQRDMSRNPLFDVSVVLQNQEGGRFDLRRELPGLSVTSVQEERHVVSKIDLNFGFAEVGNSIHCRIEYNNDIYFEATAHRIGEHLEQLIAAIVENPVMPVGLVPYLSNAEQQELLYDFNHNPPFEPAYDTLNAMFEEQVQLHPALDAVVFGERHMTYHALNQRVNRLAHYLRDLLLIRPGDLVGVMMRRSDDLIVTILAILKSGGAYVPIDPEYPRQRIDYMLEDSACRVVLDEEMLKQAEVAAASLSGENPSRVNRPEDLAYVIYTSGSTGRPKGVMIQHASIVNSIASQRALFGVETGERSLQFATASFDASVAEIFISLAAGGALYIINEAEKRDPAVLEKYISEQAIDIATIPPAYLKLLRVEKLKPLKKLVSAGEAANLQQAIAFSREATFFNAYGPTEGSITLTIHKIGPGELVEGSSIPIGRPLHNTQAYILDAHKQLVPVGVFGDLYFSGRNLAKGYLNQPELTASKFVRHPFEKDGCMYQTGDVARWLPGGVIEFTGRKDHQVKIRGYRIELSEIEQVLQAHPLIESAVAVVRVNQREEKEIAAYAVGKEAVDEADIRSYLSATLPLYMMPAHVVLLDQLPLNRHGKVDRGRLPDPGGLILSNGQNYVAPSGPVEQMLVRIWEQVLEKEGIGVQDDYFVVGGDSLKAISIIQKVLEETGVVIPIQVVFQDRTVAQVAAWVGGAMTGLQQRNAINQQNLGVAAEWTPISYNQRAFLTGSLKESPPVITPYHFADLDLPAFAQAVQELIARHEILRTRFVQTEAGILQQVIPVEEAFSGLPPVVVADTEEAFDRITRAAHERMLDPFTGPLMVVEVYQRPENEYVVLLSMHHALTDGYSDGVLRREIIHLYKAARQQEGHGLKPLPCQYRDYSRWQQSFVHSPEGERHRAYWLSQLEGCSSHAMTVASEWGDLQGPQSASCVTRLLEGGLLEKIDVFARKNGLTRPGVLMATLVNLLTTWTGQEAACISVTVSNRNSTYYGDLDVSGLIGLFANPIVIAGKFDKTWSVTDYYKKVQSQFLEALSYDAYPMEKIREDLSIARPGANIEPPAYFNYHNYAYLRTQNYRIDPEELAGRLTLRPPMERCLGLAVKEYRNCLKLELSFSHRYFSEERATHLSARFCSLLAQAVGNEKLPVDQLMETNQHAKV